MTILIDFDDTMTDLLPTWVDVLNSRFGENVDWRNIRQWDICKAFPRLTDEEVFAPLTEDSFWDLVQPKKDAVYYIRKLVIYGFDVVVLTASSPDTIKSKFYNCMQKHFPFIDFKDVIVSSRKYLIKGDVMVDDAVHNFDKVNCYCKILMDAPHNQSFDNKAKGIVRVGDWAHAYNAICGFAERVGFTNR